MKTIEAAGYSLRLLLALLASGLVYLEFGGSAAAALLLSILAVMK